MEHEIVAFLSALADDQNLIQRAMDGYKRTIELDPACLPTHLQPEDVQGVFRSQSLTFKSMLSYPYIDTSLDLVAHGELIGYYRLIRLLDGTVDDDYFVLEE